MNTTTLAAAAGDDFASQLADKVAAVKSLIAAGLLSPEALGLEATSRPALVPGEPITVRDLAVKTLAGLKTSTASTYRTYLTFIVDGWPAAAPAEEKLYLGLGDRLAHEVLPADLEEALRWVGIRAEMSAQRKTDVREELGRHAVFSDGTGAKFNAVGAWRAMFNVAVKNRHLAKGFDPAQEVQKPRRGLGSRVPMEQHELDEMLAVVQNTGNDPELDLLLCQTILIGGARREGLLNLELRGIDRDECTIMLDEKFDKRLAQPVPDWFVERLYAFAVSRGATQPRDKVFRTRPTGQRPSRPITHRRLDNLFQRVQSSLPWADRKHVTAHVLRHHAIAVIQEASRRTVSLAFARHEPEGTHDRYGRATPREVAQVVVQVYGGDHPWLHRPRKD